MLYIKREVAIKMCFAKKVVLNISGESREVAYSFSKMLEKSFWSSSLLVQLLFKYFSKILPRLHFRFPRTRTFQNTSFSHPFMVAPLGITRQLTRWETVVLLILFTFFTWCLWGKIKSLGIYTQAEQLRLWILNDA